MTTFTMQDLTHLPNTPEEDEAMQALAEKQEHPFKTILQHPPMSLEQAEEWRRQVEEPTINDIINNICTQLQLLSTVINQTKAQPTQQVEENFSSNASLQDCVSSTLEQADWFKELVEQQIEERVDSEVENYFERRFDPSDHYDFGDAVSDAVQDRLADVVEDRLDEVVAEQLEKLVAEKLSNIRISFD